MFIIYLSILNSFINIYIYIPQVSLARKIADWNETEKQGHQQKSHPNLSKTMGSLIFGNTSTL